MGGTLSRTNTVCVQVAMLLQASVAFQVRVTVASQGIKPFVTSVKVMATLPGQLSCATGVPGHGFNPVWQVTVALGGQVMLGGVDSPVWMPMVQVLVLPHQSVTVKVTVWLAQPVKVVGLTESDCI